MTTTPKYICYEIVWAAGVQGGVSRVTLYYTGPLAPLSANPDDARHMSYPQVRKWLEARKRAGRVSAGFAPAPMQVKAKSKVKG